MVKGELDRLRARVKELEAGLEWALSHARDPYSDKAGTIRAMVDWANERQKVAKLLRVRAQADSSTRKQSRRL